MSEAEGQQRSRQSLHDEEKYPGPEPIGSKVTGDTRDTGVQVPVETGGTGQEQSSDLVEFDGPDDPENPLNWPKRRKWAITISMGTMTFVVTISSSIYVCLVACCFSEEPHC